jgi:hypothetical protein
MICKNKMFIVFKNHTIKTCGRLEVKTHEFLASALDGPWVALHHWRGGGGGHHGIQPDYISQQIPHPIHVHPEDGGSMLLRNVGTHPQGYTTSQERRPQYEQ